MGTYRLNSIWILLGILIASLLSSCTSSIKRYNEEFEERNYEVSSFNKIRLQGAYNVHIVQNSTPAFKMEASEENQKKIEVWVENETLNVKTRSTTITTQEVKLNITIDQLELLKIEGGVFLTTDGYIEVEDLEISVEGGAHIDMKLTANTLRARCEGGVNMEFEGVTDEFHASTEGAGNIDADQLKSRIVRCKVAGVGNASVYATEQLDATVEGLGKIAYRGNPVINKQVSGIGMVYKK